MKCIYGLCKQQTYAGSLAFCRDHNPLYTRYPIILRYWR